MSILRVVVALLAAAGIGWLVYWDIENPQVSFISSFFAAQIPSVAVLVLLGWRTRYLSNLFLSFKTAVYGNALAVAGTLFLPARLGDLGKPLYFKALSGFPASKGLVLVIEERIWDFVGLAMLAILTLYLIGEQAESAALLTASYVTMTIAVVGLFCILVLPRLVTHIPFLASLEAKYELFGVKSTKQILTLLVSSLLIWTASLAILIIAYHFTGLPELRFAQLLFLFVASTLGLVISVTPGSIGTYEGAIVAVLVGFDVSWDSALAFAIGFRLTWLALPVALATYAVVADAKLLALIKSYKAS